MRSPLYAAAVAALIFGTACGRSGVQPSAESGATVIGKPAALASGPLSEADLKLFAPLPANMFVAGTQPSSAQIALGRRLYHETLLSAGHDVSCNSCHPLNGFGADGRAVSFGNVGHTGARNSPTVYNAAGHLAQFWDGRAPTVEEQAKGPVLNPLEMAMPNAEEVVKRLRASPDYPRAFAAAFPKDASPVTYDNLGLAIGAFERGLVTPSPWDSFLKGDTTALDAGQKRGAKAFVAAGCVTCHNGAYVGGNAFQKAGLVHPWPSLADSGRFNSTKNAADMFVFKVPSLRNVAMTGPYFHDGSVTTLQQAVQMMGRHQLGIELNPEQNTDIRSYLGSLTGTLPAEYIAEPQLPAAGTR